MRLDRQLDPRVRITIGRAIRNTHRLAPLQRVDRIDRGGNDADDKAGARRYLEERAADRFHDTASAAGQQIGVEAGDELPDFDTRRVGGLSRPDDCDDAAAHGAAIISNPEPTFPGTSPSNGARFYIVDYNVDMPPYLGEFEQLLLLAVIRLGADAYGADIARELEARDGKSVVQGK